MRKARNQWWVFIVLFMTAAGCRESRWAIEVPKTYEILATKNDSSLRESSVCYELRDSSGGAFGEILKQAGFAKADEEELDAALKEAALVLQRSEHSVRVVYTACLKVEGRDCDTWLLVDEQRSHAILLMTRG